MWSVGCIFAELLTKKPLFVTKVQSELAQLKTIFEARSGNSWWLAAFRYIVRGV